MTTRYRDDDFLGALMGTIHETGHAPLRAEPAARAARPAGGRGALDRRAREPEPVVRDAARRATAASSDCSRRCWREHFGAQPAFEPDNLQRLLTRVRARPDPRRRRRGDLPGARDPALRDRAPADRRRDRGRGHPGAVGREDGRAARPRHARQLQATAACRTCTGAKARSATSRATRWARCTRRSGSPRCARHAGPRRAHRARRAGAVFDWLRDNVWSQASRWKPTSWSRARAASARPGALQGASGGALPARVTARRCDRFTQSAPAPPAHRQGPPRRWPGRPRSVSALPNAAHAPHRRR